MQDKNDIIEKANRLVEAMLDTQGEEVELELNTISVDAMPHTTWLLRYVGAAPTTYLAKDVAHTHELAMQAAQDKARLLGVQIAKINDTSKGARHQQ